MIAYNVVLMKIQSNHNNLRTNEVEGQTLALPEIGKQFQMVGASLTPENNQRWVTTTMVTELEKVKDDFFTFKTQNSEYALKVLGTEEVK